ncbi:MAG: ribokinase [Parachlamydiales bacterium]|nr:ribokinase [Parachlamydiales bacterium]
MRFLNFGSLNIDYVYRVHELALPGQTVSSFSESKFFGGKGAIQSAALASSGCQVFHAGKVGKDGQACIDTLKNLGVDTHLVLTGEYKTGMAIIQVDDRGQNSIIIASGANKQITTPEIDLALKEFDSDTTVLLQNETSEIGYVMRKAKEKGMKICLNPAPMDPSIRQLPLNFVDILILNEREAMGLAGGGTTREIADSLGHMLPQAEIILTLGDKGVLYHSAKQEFYVPAAESKVIDSTGASDAFLGYYMAAISQGKTIEESLKIGCIAGAICVSRPGAVESVPKKDEVEAF